MIDELLFKTNHLGKDGFTWWIGQVADATVWKAKTLPVNYTDPDKKDTNWPERCKVRIIGYHSFNKNELDDKELPLAHIMMDPTLGSGQGGEGITSNLQGGEVCFGFFLDGDDAQQPVIVGLLPRPRQAKNELEDRDFAFKPFTGYTGTVPPTKRTITPPSPPKEAPAPPTFTDSSGTEYSYDGNPFTGWGSTDSFNNRIPFNFTTSFIGAGDTSTQLNYNVNFNDYITTTGENAAVQAFIKATTFTYVPPSECKNNLIGQITQILQDFIGFTNGIQKYAEVYIDPILNTVVDITSQIRSAVESVASIIRLIINSLRGTIIKCVTALFKKFFNLQKDPLKTILSQSFKNIINIVYCIFEQILPQLLDFLTQLLSDMVDNVTSAPLCAINSLVSGILAKVMDTVESALDVVLSGVSWLTGGLSSVFNVLNQASSLATQIYNFISCDDLKCTTPSKWVSNIGPSQEAADNWSKMVGDVNVFKGISEDLGSIESAISGLPIYTGSMANMTGRTITQIKTILQEKTILTISNPGTGYTTGITTYRNVPLVSVTGVGDGARATIGVGTGVVYSAVVTKSGKGYNQGDILTVDKKNTGNLGSGLLFVVPEVKTIVNSYYDACANSVNDPKTQDDLPPNDGSTKYKKCIPPKVEVYPDGYGAKLTPVIRRGKIIHIDINSPGFGYEYEPTITIVDKSGYGKSAKAISKIDENGSITDVIILDTGLGYCPPPVGIGSTTRDIDMYLTASRTRIYEGDSVTFIITSSDNETPTEVEYSLRGIDQQFISQPISGVISLTDGRAEFKVDTLIDEVNSTKDLTLELPLYDKKRNVLVEDSRENPKNKRTNYSLSADEYIINEGSPFKIKLKTKNVDDGTSVPFVIRGVNEDLIQDYSTYTAFEVFDNEAEIKFKTKKGVISKNAMFRLELVNNQASIGISINKVKTIVVPEPQLCVTGLQLIRPGIGYGPNDTATDGINTYELIISPANGAIFGAKPISTPICGYNEPPVIIINTLTGIGAELVPTMKLDDNNSNTIVNAAALAGISTDSIKVVDCV